MDVLSESAAVAKSSVSTGANALERIFPKIETLSKAGLLIKQSIDNKTVDAVKFKELGDAIGEMAKVVNQSFEQLKSSAVFYQDAYDISDQLVQMLKELLSNPSSDTLEYFKNSFDMNTPIETSYKLISLLEKKSTNPMRSTVATAPKDWQTVFERILGQFLYLESIANGMFQSQNMYTPKALKRRIERFNGEVDEWNEDYLAPLWAGYAKKVVETIQRDNTGTDEKVAVLEKTLRKTFPRETIFVMVYNECDGPQNQVFLGPDNLAIKSFHLGGSNVVVVRSSKWKTRTEDVRQKFIAEIMKYKGTSWQDDYTSFVASLKTIDGLGFVALVSDTQNLSYGSVELAPGGLTNIRVEKENYSGVSLGKSFTLFAGYL